MQTILEELATKTELIFNPETLTHAQREEVIQAKYREDIYLVPTIDGKWKIWKRIFN